MKLHELRPSAGAFKASKVANETLKRVQKAVGLLQVK